MTSNLHPFDGEHLTIAQIHERIPALSQHIIRRLVSRGLTTSVAMLSWRPSISANARKGRRAAERAGYNWTVMLSRRP